MHRLLRLLAVLAFVVCATPIGLTPAPAHAEGRETEEDGRLVSVREGIATIEKEHGERGDDFDGLLDLRERLDPLREELAVLIGEAEAAVTAAKAELEAFGAAPAAGSPPEAAEVAVEREKRQAAVGKVDAGLRAMRALLVHADNLSAQLTDDRRTLFSTRIFHNADSILQPVLWSHFFDVGVSRLKYRLRLTLLETGYALDQSNGWRDLHLFSSLAAVIGILMLWVRRLWLRRLGGFVPAEASKQDVAMHSLGVLVASSLPSLVIGLMLVVMVKRFDTVPDQVETFVRGLGGAAAAWGASVGILQAVFAPGAPAWRIIVCDDATAIRLDRVLRVTLGFYFTGLVALGFIAALSAPTVDTIALTAFFALIVMGSALMMVAQTRSRSARGEVRGLVEAPLHLLKPLFWVAGIAVAGALLFGFIALAGLIVGRVVASIVIVCLAIWIWVAIDVFITDGFGPDTEANESIRSLLGIEARTVDLVTTVIGGVLRVVVTAAAALTLFSPWGIEFGHVNPFVDVFFGVRFSDLRYWVGAAGIAAVLFGVGLVSTRIFVSWLDRQFLPRTRFDTGLRHSISTVAGYTGLAMALAVSLNQAGVQLQNIALVAGALSVGIGFGLQQIVSNFVAGLIVLAERPIRVGDVIVVKGEEGQVRKINVRSTELQLAEKSTVIVPNSDIISSIVKNRTLLDPTHQVTVKLAVKHESDLNKVFTILNEIAVTHPDVLRHPAPSVHFVKISENGIEIDLNVICADLANMSTVRSDLIRATVSQFREAGIGLATAAAACAAIAPD